jgi:hypothetical protein
MDKLLVEDKLITDPEQINNTVNEYYAKLYNMNTCSISDNTFFDGIFRLSENEAIPISSPITLNELWVALKPLKDTAPGPDGITHLYLKRLWDIIGPLILNSWHYAISTQKRRIHMSGLI